MTDTITKKYLGITFTFPVRDCDYFDEGQLGDHIRETLTDDQVRYILYVAENLYYAKNSGVADDRIMRVLFDTLTKAQDLRRS